MNTLEKLIVLVLVVVVVLIVGDVIVTIIGNVANAAIQGLMPYGG